MFCFLALTEKMPEIEQSLTQMENCFELLLPCQTKQSETDSPQHHDDDDSDADNEDVENSVANEPTVSDVMTNEHNDKRTKNPTSDSVPNSSVTIKQESEDSKNVTGEKDLETSNQEVSMETEDVGTDSNDGLRQHGLPSRDYNLTIRLNTGKEDTFMKYILSTNETQTDNF